MVYGKARWSKESGRLWYMSDRMFERGILPLLAVVWPGLQQGPNLGPLDRDGVDLYSCDDEGQLMCVVQCKGFKEQELGASQIKQMLASIASFHKSNRVCQDYLLVYNRYCKVPADLDGVRQALDQLVAERRASRVLLSHHIPDRLKPDMERIMVTVHPLR